MRGPDKMPRSERRSQEWQRGYQAALDDLHWPGCMKCGCMDYR